MKDLFDNDFEATPKFELTGAKVEKRQHHVLTYTELHAKLVRSGEHFDPHWKNGWQKLIVPGLKAEYIFKPDGTLHETRKLSATPPK